jgi:hypothetical protein
VKLMPPVNCTSATLVAWYGGRIAKKARHMPDFCHLSNRTGRRQLDPDIALRICCQQAPVRNNAAKLDASRQKIDSQRVWQQDCADGQMIPNRLPAFAAEA